MSKSPALALMIALGLFSASTIVSASEPSTIDAPAKKKKPKKICKSNSGVTGSRIAKRVCKTEEEWATTEDGQEVGAKSKGGAITPG